MAAYDEEKIGLMDEHPQDKQLIDDLSADASRANRFSHFFYT